MEGVGGSRESRHHQQMEGVGGKQTQIEKDAVKPFWVIY